MRRRPQEPYSTLRPEGSAIRASHVGPSPHERLTLPVVGRSQLLARWPETLSRILSATQREAQTVSGVILKTYLFAQD